MEINKMRQQLNIDALQKHFNMSKADEVAFHIKQIDCSEHLQEIQDRLKLLKSVWS